MSRILRRAAAIVRDRVDVASVRWETVTVGARTIMVELDPGAGPRPMRGLAHSPTAPTAFEDPIGSTSVDGVLARLEESTSTGPDATFESARRALAVATLNALAAPTIDWGRGDPMAGLGDWIETIATVGLFGPAFRKFDGVTVHVVERQPVESPPTPSGGATVVHPPAGAAAAFAVADVVFLTGSVFVYGGIDEYLERIPSSTPTVLVGETAPLPPGAAFEADIDAVAGALVTDPAAARAAVDRGACGTDLHDSGVRKVLAVRPGWTVPTRSDGSDAGDSARSGIASSTETGAGTGSRETARSSVTFTQNFEP